MRRCGRPAAPARAAAIAAGALGAAAAALAAGGHFDVDDATVLDVGRCQVEAWGSTASTRRATLQHVAPGCRVGFLEATLNLDRQPAAGGTSIGPQLKWATGGSGGAWAVGAVALATRAPHARRWSSGFYVPATLVPWPGIALNLNVGADRPEAGKTSGRAGASIEWQALPRATVIAERIRFLHADTSRLGLRGSLGNGASVDGSVARNGALRATTFTLGLNAEFARP